jgi:hypothetical protein
MIYKVEIVNQIAVDMAVKHMFESVVQDGQQAFEFGKEASDYAFMFNAGFGEGQEEADD